MEQNEGPTAGDAAAPTSPTDEVDLADGSGASTEPDGPADEPGTPAEPDRPAEADGPGDAPIGPEPTRHGRLPRHTGPRATLKLVASVVAVVAVSATAVAAYAAVDLVGSVKQGASLASEDMLDGVPDIGAMDGGLNFLLVGSDKRPADGSFGDPEEDSGILNDVNMLLHVSQDHSHVEVVSFPRDMIVPVPECPDPVDPTTGPLSAMSGVPLNSVLSHGGLTCVAMTIEQLTGTKIPVAGVVEFKGVAALSEAVGGVEVCLADPIDDPASGLKLTAGTHSIKGFEALAFLRTRKATNDGSDLGRIASQQAFLASLARTLQSSGTLSDPVKLYSIAKAVLSNMELSKELQNPARLMSIARALADTDLSKIAFVQYPTAGYGDGVHVEPAESAEAVNLALQADRPVVIDPTANDNAGYGTSDPTTPAVEAATTDADTETESAEEAQAVDTGTDSGGDAAAPASAEPATTPAEEQLPPDVTGLTGTQVRCVTGNGD
ncbi:LCP family protein [Agromyces endophyticus]|uniref:LCP family protein n=1 Tax=Agromyces sp. H17E-10 TaxID=2932244 RepID=UPI001FD3477F|nr:LCP family protein [Agromyces sp. H17E-10]UOQ90713.1 LCP family protein [Agromyces sp. H17E-10]